MNLSGNTVPAFITPVINYLWPDSETLNARLAELVQDMANSEAGLNRSNVGGWHSGMDFLQRDDEAINTLRQRMREFAESVLRQFAHADAAQAPMNFSLEGWANLLRQGQYNSVHCHPNAAWSMVYYVTSNQQVADNPFSGKLELIDPRPGAGLTYSEQTTLYGRFLVNPHAGQMLAFPAWLQHQVHPCAGDGTRISIAANVLVG
ncbi:hypothetical protein E4634_20295 [Mangrovimicrobium sediminis]|uniref:2OG-Fe(II) oxygenase n=1 Tax=Mangrovimicrobium sediminis TaxID=2562682 RepID=A0A4Z0LV14_9GAMM|nr:TIGR02466 family protein [Haliea sp. SAOS-164]TGD70946.1 hypothetical protein E4634_20295 [Haliea sp. SAOS-164]